MMHEKPVQVTAAVIKKGDLILIAQRKKDSWLEPNKWEFPGGKIEQTETPEICIIREVKEELDLDIKITGLFSVITHTYCKENKDYPVQIYVYLTEWKHGQVKNIDCQDSRWISPTELKNYEFVEADKPLVNDLIIRLK